jgi:hypothetical protein
LLAKGDTWATGLRMEATRLNLSSSAPLNLAPKPLPLLAWNMETETRKGAGKTGSIARKVNPINDLAALLFIR